MYYFFIYRFTYVPVVEYVHIYVLPNAIIISYHPTTVLLIGIARSFCEHPRP